MRYFKIFLMERGREKVVTENAMKQMEADTFGNGSSKYAGQFKIIGECDQAGNLIENIAEGNFTNFVQPERQKRPYTKRQQKSTDAGDEDEPSGDIDLKPTKEQLDRRDRNNAEHQKSLNQKTDEQRDDKKS